MRNDSTSQPCAEWAEMLAMIQSGDLSIEDSKALGAHLFSCSCCSDTLDDYRLIHSYMQRSMAAEPLPDLPPGLLQRNNLWQQALQRLQLALKVHKWLITIIGLIGTFTFLLGWQILLNIDIKLAIVIILAPATIVSLCITVILKLSESRSRAQEVRGHTTFFKNILKSRKEHTQLPLEDWQDVEVGPLAMSAHSLAIKRQRSKRGWRDRNLLFGVTLSLLVSIIAMEITLFISSPSHIIPTIVTNLQDSGPGSLRQVVNTVPGGSTITFASGLHGTIPLTSGDLLLNKNLTLYGGKSITPRITISNNNHGYKVHISPAASVSINDLAFKGSTVKNNAFIYNEGKLTLTDSIVSGNTSYYSGGGIATWNGTLTINNSTVTGNQANGNGGGIYNLQSTLTIVNSTVSDNTSYDNGGGIYALRGTVTIINSTISSNATKATDSNGGGINILNGLLNLTENTIQKNSAFGDGGGIAVLGSQASIDSSTISHNSAGQKGGGLAVEVDSDNGYPSQAIIKNMSLNASSTAQYVIGENHAPSQPDILGKQFIGGPAGPLVVSESSIKPTKKISAILLPPEQSPQFLGNADINAFCQAKGYRNGASLDVKTAYDSKCLLASDEPANFVFNVAQVCQWQYSQPDAIDRLADYYDPSSWQCYVHEKMLGNLAKNIDLVQTYCQNQYRSKALLNGSTAYDWKCMSSSRGLMGLSMTSVCRQFYHNASALDRLADFNNPYSWQCWAPT